MVEGRHVVITGHLRCRGSSVLRTLHCHPRTLCRQAPNLIPENPFAALQQRGADAVEEFASRWRSAVNEARLNHSDADRAGEHPKAYDRGPFRRALARRRNRDRSAPSREWQIAPFFAQAGELEDALPVMHLPGAAEMVRQAFAADPDLHVVHAIRSPVATLRSWWHECPAAPERMYDETLAATQPVLTHYRRSVDSFADYSLQNLLMLELYRWRYANEQLMMSLGEEGRVLVFPVELLSDDLLEAASRIYRFADLALGPDVQDELEAVRGRIVLRTPRAHDLPDEVVIAVCEQVLDASPLSEIYAIRSELAEIGVLA